VAETLSRTLSSSCFGLGLLCCVLSAQCSTPRPREPFASATVRDVSSPQASDAGDAGASATLFDASDAAREPAADASAADAASADAGAADATEAAVLAACGEPPVSTAGFSRQRLLEAGGRCATYHYCAFRTTAQALERATDAYARERSEPQLKAAQAAFRVAMARWSRAELFQFGPAASSSMSAGRDIYQGKGGRDRIYSWPTVSRCRVEEQLAEAMPDPSSALISARGLFALEYSLFFAGQGSECAASSRTAMVFGQLSADALSERKARYAAALSADLGAQAQVLIDAWSPSGDNFLERFKVAEGYPSEQEALNVLGWALIYVEREMKDWKLGIPAGFTMTAPVSMAESPYAGFGTEALRENLRGFRALFQGCGAQGEGIGFDDWLQDAGHGELSDAILEEYEKSQRALDMLAPLPMASKAQLEAAYTTLRGLTSLLKGDLFGAGSPLGLKLPASVEGDTD
jgi:predicted lipoprotein